MRIVDGEPNPNLVYFRITTFCYEYGYTDTLFFVPEKGKLHLLRLHTDCALQCYKKGPICYHHR